MRLKDERLDSGVFGKGVETSADIKQMMSRMISAGTTTNQQGSLIHRRPSLDTDSTLLAGMKRSQQLQDS